jgi:ABC-type sugar transport system permease subunit
LGAVIAMDIWGGIGFYGVLFFAALSSTPEELCKRPGSMGQAAGI